VDLSVRSHFVAGLSAAACEVSDERPDGVGIQGSHTSELVVVARTVMV
jgi:hypothetical protein